MILDEIIRRTEKRVAGLPPTFSKTTHVAHASLKEAIEGASKKNAIIAEIKCASPSRGIIRRNVDIPVMAGVFVDQGCVALSILTEPYFFGGVQDDIAKVKSAVNVPVLRKDFIINKRQIAETCSLGADAVLLIAAVLGADLRDFVDEAYNAGLEPLVEVRTDEDVRYALATRAQLIGINNRDLTTLSIDRSATRRLSEPIRAAGKTVISESGIQSADDIREMRPFCDAFLIGSAIMSDRKPGRKLEELVCA
jgi:indole-3-glycerol phosphate synthase